MATSTSPSGRAWQASLTPLPSSSPDSNSASSGVGSVTNEGSGTVILAGNNTYSGGTTINAGALQIGDGGATGSLNSESPIVDNGTLIFNSTTAFTLAGFNAVISGTGNVIARGGGVIKVVGNNTYTGWTRIDANTIFWPREGQDGGLVSSVVTNNGTLRLVSQDTTFTYPGPIVGTGRVQIGANAVNFGVPAVDHQYSGVRALVLETRCWRTARERETPFA